jgi:hypothetical protein
MGENTAVAFDPHENAKFGKRGAEFGKLGGRPLGSTDGARNVRAMRHLSAVLRDLERTPVHVMIKNQLFWFDQAETLGRDLRALIKASPTLDGEIAAHLLKIATMFLEGRDKSQRCAAEAAPYLHARLTAVAVAVDGVNRIEVSGGLPDEAEQAPVILEQPAAAKP